MLGLGRSRPEILRTPCWFQQDESSGADIQIPTDRVSGVWFSKEPSKVQWIWMWTGQVTLEFLPITILWLWLHDLAIDDMHGITDIQCSRIGWLRWLSSVSCNESTFTRLDGFCVGFPGASVSSGKDGLVKGRTQAGEIIQHYGAASMHMSTMLEIVWDDEALGCLLVFNVCFTCFAWCTRIMSLVIIYVSTHFAHYVEEFFHTCMPCKQPVVAFLEFKFEKNMNSPWIVGFVLLVACLKY